MLFIQGTGEQISSLNTEIFLLKSKETSKLILLQEWKLKVDSIRTLNESKKDPFKRLFRWSLNGDFFIKNWIQMVKNCIPYNLLLVMSVFPKKHLTITIYNQNMYHKDAKIGVLRAFVKLYHKGNKKQSQPLKMFSKSNYSEVASTVKYIQDYAVPDPQSSSDEQDVQAYLFHREHSCEFSDENL